MRQLSAAQFTRAVDFIYEQGRPLERALFTWHFHGSERQVVLRTLAAFQNDDGGFGNALEPDLRTPLSSALATGIALNLLVELAADVNEPMLIRVVSYLIDSINMDTMCWRVIPNDANKAVHAPWWHDKEGSLERTFDDFLIIPRVQLTALLCHFAALVPHEWLVRMVEESIRAIEQNEDFGSGGGSDMEYAQLLSIAPGLTVDQRARLEKRIRMAGLQVVSRDPAEWTTYCITPLKLAPRPDSLLGRDLKAEVERHLDYLVEHQDEAGAWWPVWSWGDFYPDVWPQARREWAAIITLENLRILRAYNRLETA